jgi:hypothetical protein
MITSPCVSWQVLKRISINFRKRRRKAQHRIKMLQGKATFVVLRLRLILMDDFASPLHLCVAEVSLLQLPVSPHSLSTLLWVKRLILPKLFCRNLEVDYVS